MSDERIFLAVLLGNLGLLKKLLAEDKIDPNQTDEYGNTPLLKASAQGANLDIIIELLKHGANPNTENSKHETPLKIAEKSGCKHIARTLLEYGADPNFRKEITHRSLIQYMIDLGYESNKSGICFGFSNMAMQAILSEDIKTFDNRLYIIQRDADTDKEKRLSDIERNKEGITPFLDGIELYFQSVKYQHLFEPGKNPCIQDTLSTAPLVMSKTIEEQGGLVQSAKFSGVYDKNELIEYFKSLKELIENAIPHYSKPVVLLLGSANHSIMVGYDPTNKDEPWIFIDAQRMPTLYLENEEDIADAVMDGFSTSLSKAVFNTEVYTTRKNKDSLGAVISNWQAKDGSWDKLHRMTDAKAKCRDKFGGSWLHLAARGEINIVKELLEHGANPNQKTNEGAMPLHMAVLIGGLEIVETLLSHGANPNGATDDGLTPLHIAAQEGDFSVVKELLSHGANPKAAMKNGLTPIHLAEENKHPDVARLIQDKLHFLENELAAPTKRVKSITTFLDHQKKPSSEKKDKVEAQLHDRKTPKVD